MSVSYAIREEVNFQTVIWAMTGATYRSVMALMALIVGCVPMVIVASKTAACLALIVAALAVTVTYPALVVCGFVLVCVAYVSMPR